MEKIYPPTLEITNCSNCPHKEEANHYSTDGWDRMVDWQCKANKNKVIQGAVEWHEISKIEVPRWCPLRVKRKKQ